jgi:hypothetical protein
MALAGACCSAQSLQCHASTQPGLQLVPLAVLTIPCARTPWQVLLKGDGQLVWHPNNTLRTQPLVNLSRSQPRWEGYTWLVDMDTPDEVRLAACSINPCAVHHDTVWHGLRACCTRGGIEAYSWWQQSCCGGWLVTVDPGPCCSTSMTTQRSHIPCVFMCCAAQVLTELQDALAAYVATPAQRAHFSCNPAVTWRALEDPLKLRLSVGVTYSFTGVLTASCVYCQLQHQPLSTSNLPPVSCWC